MPLLEMQVLDQFKTTLRVSLVELITDGALAVVSLPQQPHRSRWFFRRAFNEALVMQQRIEATEFVPIPQPLQRKMSIRRQPAVGASSRI